MRRQLLVFLLAGIAALGPGVGPSAMAATVTLAQADDGSSPDGNPSSDPGTPGIPDPSLPWWQWQNADPLTADQQFEAQVYYNAFWKTRQDSFGSPSYETELQLASKMDGAPLAGDLAVLHQFEASGQAQVVQVEHHLNIQFVGDNDIVVYDSYVDHSYVVDAKTQQAVDGGPPANPSTANMAFHLRKFPSPDPRAPDDWKVADSVRLTN